MYRSQNTVLMPLLEGLVTAREDVEATVNLYDSESQNLEWLWISREKLPMGMHLHPASLNPSIEDAESKLALWWVTLN